MRKLLPVFLLLVLANSLSYAKRIPLRELRGKIGQELKEYSETLDKNHLQKINSYLKLGNLKGWKKKKKLREIQGDYNKMITAHESYESLLQEVEEFEHSPNSSEDSLRSIILDALKNMNLRLDQLDTLQLQLTFMISPSVGDTIRCEGENPSIVWSIGKVFEYGQIKGWMSNMVTEFTNTRGSIRDRLNTLILSCRAFGNLNERAARKEEANQRLSNKTAEMKKEVRSLQNKYLIN